ncbi:hypothetical protein CEXT_250241 [Caerostris extrusa]|uniref:Uncharacterized protein n=1 Tax=Caerostris extrusa TaxID=172846 RepID=A0AAV4PXB1_CAEEX|nr:hypothetical protein CEXT_250241 [Caerostris extrusa]
MIFSDELTFPPFGMVNRHNLHIWERIVTGPLYLDAGTVHNYHFVDKCDIPEGWGPTVLSLDIRHYLDENFYSDGKGKMDP